MATLIYLDTHVAIWLYAGKLELIPQASRERLDQNDLLISPMVELELQYLYEIDRVSEPANKVVETLAKEIGLEICDLPFSSVIAESLSLDWTRDPFDRIIVGQARLRNATLLTKDRTLHAQYPGATWS